MKLEKILGKIWKNLENILENILEKIWKNLEKFGKNWKNFWTACSSKFVSPDAAANKIFRNLAKTAVTPPQGGLGIFSGGRMGRAPGGGRAGGRGGSGGPYFLDRLYRKECPTNPAPTLSSYWRGEGGTGWGARRGIFYALCTRKNVTPCSY